jgi:AraC-like DNA-binding protein
MARLRLSTGLVDVMTVTCDLPRSGFTEAHHIRRTWIGVPTSGLFRLHSRGDEQLVHPAVGVVFPAGGEYRMTHPVDGGDTGVALTFRDDVTEEALAGRVERVRTTGLDVRVRHGVALLLAALRRRDATRVEELALQLLRSVSRDVATDPPARSSAARAKVDRVRLLLAERPEERWTLERLARRVGWSPYHLAHQFRLYTGATVHRYLEELRLAAALRRIEAGDTSLAALAVELGFSHHSHMTARLRRSLGVTPRAIREQLSARR